MSVVVCKLIFESNTYSNRMKRSTISTGVSAGACIEVFGPYFQKKGDWNMGVFSESVEVVCSPAGQPIRLRWQNRTWHIAAEPVRWYERRKWWAEELRAERGRGAGLVDHEIWRVQARLNSRSELRTLDLSHQADTGRWRLIRVHEALQRLSA